jgi:uncharacterized protein YbjT (DUF2867 family)
MGDPTASPTISHASSASGGHTLSEAVVLVVGGTGMLGGQVVDHLVARNKRVRALVRPAAQTERLVSAGVELAAGDLREPATLRSALQGVDAVVTSAAGYTRHTPGDTLETDRIGNVNLIDAAAEAGVRRFVFTSILTCDQTPNVPHFWAKKLAEDALAERGVPFVALRPGAFVDSVGMWGGDGFAAGRIAWLGDSTVPMTFVYTPDLAEYLAAAVDADVSGGERIDIGWDRPLTGREIAEIAGRIMGRDIELMEMDPAQLRASGMPDDAMDDLLAMFDYFRTGRYVADTRRQAEVFGSVPAAEDAIRRRLAALGHVA